MKADNVDQNVNGKTALRHIKKAEKRKQKHNLNIHPTMFENNSAAKNNRPVFICWTCFYNTNETWHRFLFKT